MEQKYIYQWRKGNRNPIRKCCKTRLTNMNQLMQQKATCPRTTTNQQRTTDPHRCTTRIQIRCVDVGATNCGNGNPFLGQLQLHFMIYQPANRTNERTNSRTGAIDNAIDEKLNHTGSRSI